MSHIKLFMLISMFVGSCSQTFNVTTDSMSNSFNTGQVIKLKNKSSIERGDAVFFTRSNDSQQRKQTWLFRVVALSGDTLKIKDGNVIVNNSVIEFPENARLLYSVITSMPLDLKNFRENTVTQIAENKYIAQLTMDEYNLISKQPNVTTLNRMINRTGNYIKGIVRNDINDNWNEDQFGPLYIPSIGDRIRINQANSGLYAEILSDLQPDSTVTIKEKFYFLMGDNRSNAVDSRYIGLVSESDIIGYVEEKH